MAKALSFSSIRGLSPLELRWNSCNLKSQQKACRKHAEEGRGEEPEEVGEAFFIIIINKMPDLKLDCIIEPELSVIRTKGNQIQNILNKMHCIYFLPNGGSCQTPSRGKVCLHLESEVATLQPTEAAPCASL